MIGDFRRNLMIIYTVKKDDKYYKSRARGRTSGFNRWVDLKDATLWTRITGPKLVVRKYGGEIVEFELMEKKC